MNRREVLGSIAAGTVLATTTLAHAQAKKGAHAPAPLTPIAAGSNKVVPLSFNAAKLPGLTEKLLTSHHKNNFQPSMSTRTRGGINKAAHPTSI